MKICSPIWQRITELTSRFCRPLYRPLGCLKQLNSVAQFRRAFVELACDRAFHLTLHNLKFGQWPLGSHLLKPFFEKSDFAAFTRKLWEVGMLKEFDNGVATLLDFAHAVSKLALIQKDRCSRPCVHHQHVGPELLKIPNDLFPLAVLLNKSK